MPPSFVRVAGLAAALLGFGLPAAAQDAATEEESRRLRRGDANATAVRDAGGDAAELARFAGEDVSYADVLADPDDIAISYQWARRQVREGQLRGAAATLERILLLRPDLASVRLLYAVVLYRLDSLAEADRQLEILADGPLTVAERAEVARYQRTLRRASRRTRIDTSLSFGTSYETNRNSAPMSGTRQIQLGPSRLELGLRSEDREQDDVAFFGMTQLAVEHDLGSHEGHLLLGSFTTYVSQQEDLGDFNTRAYAIDFGGRYRTSHFDVTPMVFGSLVELSSETFMKNVGLDLAFERNETRRRGERAGLRIEWQDFDAIRQSVTSNEHTGLRVEASLGSTFRATPVHQLDADLLYRMKDARGSSTPRTNDVFSYDGPELRVRHTWLLGGGRFLISQLSAGRDSYWRADQRISTKRRRRDLRGGANLIFGVPLEGLLPSARVGALAEALSGVVLSLGADYYRVESNLPNYTYDDVKVSLVLSRQWSP